MAGPGGCIIDKNGYENGGLCRSSGNRSFTCEEASRVSRSCAERKEEVDETVCAVAPEWFQAVGQYYDDFSQTTDKEVRELLAAAAHRNNKSLASRR
ncbi:MAG: hypothetical protein DME38_02960 [Verrucomicrobia bacterium]|nr:MAG: hypothetical protein DME38_02960 [Verrucomicrobiota bacterium]